MNLTAIRAAAERGETCDPSTVLSLLSERDALEKAVGKVRAPSDALVEAVASRHWEVRHEKHLGDVTESYRKWTSVDDELQAQWRSNTREFFAALRTALAAAGTEGSNDG